MMTNNSKRVKWHNGIQNCQNGEPLPVRDPQIEGYKPVELFQWEMCIQFLSHGASMENPMSDVRDKIKSLIIKSQEMHGKDKFFLFTEKGTAFVKVVRQKYEMEEIGVFVRQPFLLLASELMQEIAPMISLKSK
eukprot:10562087-Ditylum_brightwellii.AAC.1